MKVKFFVFYLILLIQLQLSYECENVNRSQTSTSSNKKGFCYSEKDSNGWLEKLQSLNIKWFYTWNNTWPVKMPTGAEFFPMLWSGKQVTTKNIERK